MTHAPSFQKTYTTESDWTSHFDASPALREDVLGFFDQYELDMSGTPTTWSQLLDELRALDIDVQIESLAGLTCTFGDATSRALYPMVTSGWDGLGAPRSVTTQAFNLTSVASSGIAGATAHFVQRERAEHPGIVVHYNDDRGHQNTLVVFQIC